MIARSLPRDARGASFVEYIVLVGVVALFAIAGFRLFGTSARSRITREAACVSTLDCASASPAAAPGASTPVQSGSAAASREGGIGYWAGGIATGIGKGAWRAVKGTGELIFDATPIGALYDAATHKPNTAVQTVKTLGTLALWSTPPMQAITMAGGPDPIGDLGRGIAKEVKASWRRNRAETVGMGVFEVGALVLPGAEAEGLAKVGEVARLGSAAEAVEDASAAARVARGAEAAGAVEKTGHLAEAGDGVAHAANEAAQTAKNAAQSSEVARATELGTPLDPGRFAKVYRYQDDVYKLMYQTDEFAHLSDAQRATLTNMVADETNQVARVFDTRPGYRGTVPPVEVVADGVLKQRFVDGIEFDKLGPSAKLRASRDIEDYARQARDALGILDDEPKVVNGYRVGIDENSRNFRFDQNGNVTGWFDPVKIFPPKVRR